MEKELLMEFVKWLRSEYQIEEVYEMFADEFLQDRARKNLDQPDVIKSVYEQCQKYDSSGKSNIYCTNCGRQIEI